MMLDQKRRMVAQRLGFDIVFDELPIALTGIHVRPTVARGGAAEQTKAHAELSCLDCYSSSCGAAGAIVSAGGHHMTRIVGAARTAGAVLALYCAMVFSAAAQDYPTRPITL